MDRFLIDDGSRLTHLKSAVRNRVPERLVLYRSVAVVLAVLVVMLMTVLAMKTPSACPAAGVIRQECNSTACLQQAANVLSWMNSSVNPCTNFYQHVCGSFSVRNPRGDHSKYGITEKLKYYNRQRLQDLLQANNYGTDTAFNKTATLFQSCMNVHNDRQAIEHLVKLINSMGGLELFGSWSPERYNLQSTLTKLLGSLKTASIFEMRMTNQKELLMYPSLMGHYYWKRRSLLGPSTGSTDSDINSTKYERTLRHNIRTVLQTLPINNTACNHSRCLDQMVDDVLDMETQLNGWKIKRRMKIRVSLLDETMDEIDWTKLLDQLYGNQYVTNTSTITILGMSYIEDINRVIKSTPLKKMQHFLMWCLIRDSLPLLGDLFISFYNQFEAVNFARGIGVKSRSEYCIDTVRQSMPQVISALFLHTHVGLENRDAAAALFDDTMEVLFQYSSLFNSSLLSQYRNTSVSFGHADILADAGNLDIFYRPLELNSSTHYFNSIRTVREFQMAKLRTQLTETPVNEVLTAVDDLPYDSMQLVYRPRSDTLVVPFGALQPPWFSAQLPISVNTAALGSMILKRLFQKLSYTGSQASNGKKKQYITAYDRYQLCVNESFGSPEIDSSEQSIYFAGVNILKRSNNVLSDHFALKSSWRLFNRLSSRNTSLPGLSHLSPQQLFFTAFAQARCESGDSRSVFFRRYFHSTESIINNLMYNDNAFKRVFKCHAVPHKYADKRQCELN